MRKSPWLGKLSKVGFILAVLTPIIGFGLSNLCLMSTKGRSFLSEKITSLTGLEASLEGATWSPWNGITFYGIRVEQPAPLQEQIAPPLLLVESLRLSPVWSALKNRRLLIKSIEIRLPELSLPVELLSQLPSQEPVPQIALNNQNIPQSAPQNQLPPVASRLGHSNTTNPNSEESQPPAALPPTKPKIESISGKPSLTTWVNFLDARFRVVSAFTTKPLCEASGIRGSVPIGGKPVNSMIKIGPVECLGNLLAREMKIPIRSQGTFLTTDTIKTSFSGIDCELTVAVSFTRGLPFQITTAIPEQDDSNVELSPALGIQVETLAGEGRLHGLIRSPGTWQGWWIVKAHAISGEYETNKVQFDEGQALVVFRDGALRCLDARMIGDDTSFLGNASLLKDGRMAAAARIVSAPETLLAISRFSRPDHSAPHLTPLNTPQRSALDLQLFGTPGNLFYKPDPKTDAVPLAETFSPD